MVESKQTKFEKTGKNEVLLIPGDDGVGKALGEMDENDVELLLRKFLEDKKDSNKQNVGGSMSEEVEIPKCDLGEGDIVRLRVLDGVYTTFNKVPEEKYVESEWRPRGPKFRAGASCLVVDTGWGHGTHWIKVIIPGEGQGWIKRQDVQVIE